MKCLIVNDSVEGLSVLRGGSESIRNFKFKEFDKSRLKDFICLKSITLRRIVPRGARETNRLLQFKGLQSSFGCPYQIRQA